MTGKGKGYLKLLFLLFMVLISTTAGFAVGNSGAIWSTMGDCGDETQDSNHFAIGDEVYINGHNFDPNTEYDWEIAGQPGGASCDPGDVVASGSFTTDAAGAFCFYAYTVQNDDCGEYKITFGNKGDNYRVEANPSIDIEKSTNGEDADSPTGPEIMEGEPVLWEYTVTNTGDALLTDIEVVDDQLGLIGTIDELAPGESVTLQKSGTATAGQYANVGTATSTFDKEEISDSDPSHYLGIAAEPSLDIEKATNGQDADEPTGPSITVGDQVTWTYVVTNTGNVTLTDIEVTDDQVGSIGTIGSLAPGESVTFTKTGTATLGQYANIGTVSAIFNGEPVEDSDPSHYLGVEADAPSLDIEKATNGQDADEPTGPSITVGDQVTWTYAVTNTGNVTLTNIEVTDDQVGPIGTIGSLEPGESVTFTKTGTATLGQYANIGTASAAFNGEPVEDSDPSHYLGVAADAPSLNIEKATNGQDADEATGPQIMEGSPVTWTYVVTNTGNVTLTNIVVSDDMLGVIGTITSLAAGQSTTLTATGTATAGQYCNVGTASAEYQRQTVEDSDPSHYFGVRAQLDIEKSTNGVDADEAPGLYLFIGDEVEWKYVVTNTGNVPLENIVVTDDQLGDICTIGYLGVGEQSYCTVEGVAEEGQYANLGSACGYYGEYKVCDEDPSHYFGSERPMPSIDIEKATNGEDADAAPGPMVQEGSTVTWTYVVTNTGNVPLTNIVVTDDKEGEICTIPLLEVGESKECQATGLAVVGLYENLGSVCGWYDDEEVTDDDPSHYVGEKFTPTEPDDFVVCISFKDNAGNYVGDVLAVLSIPGAKDWKVLSSWDEILAAGSWPCNAHFRNLAQVIGGTYKFKFTAPDGWKFVSPDHMEIEVTANEQFYSVSGNIFYLERTTTTNSTTVNPEEPQQPADEASNSLVFVQGSQTARGEDWGNAVDGDTEDWDGTTTAQRGNDNSPAFAIFRFADGNTYQFSHVKLQTDNGPADDKWSSRQATKIELLVSTEGLDENSFVSAGIFNVKTSDMALYKLSHVTTAKYVKLVLLQPTWTSGGWAQIVEFGLDSPSKRGPELASQAFSFSLVPEVFGLSQNYPNPFNPLTTIQYDLPSDAQVMLAVYDVTGRQVAALVNERQNAGSYSVVWDASEYPSGLYFYRLQADQFSAIHKMTLIK